MEQFVLDQIKYGLKYLPANAVKSHFIPKSTDETKAMRKRGFVCGVCHPDENFALLREANIGWARFDIPFPFDADGNESDGYRAFKKRAKSYADNGIRVMAVSPFPDSFVEHGIDPRTPEGKEGVRKVARFLITDLQGYVGGIQISNEMGLPRFTLPLTTREAAEFVGIQAEEMYPLRKDVIIGYNSAGPEALLHSLMRPYHKYCDYVGVDIYLGCFEGLPGTIGLFETMVRYLWGLTGKPVLVQEFGYIGSGAPKSPAEKRAILQSWGIEREEDAAADIDAFVDRLPQNFQYNIRHDGKDDPSRYYNLLFHSDMRQHFYKEMKPGLKIPGYPHTPEGQARFFDAVISRLYSLPFVCGAIVYCWSDAPKCYVCGQPDCPVETCWGLVDNAGKTKPSFYAVKRQFGRIRFFNAAEKR